MPRDGSNVYHKPVGTDGVPNLTILSARYNAYTDDIQQDLNLPRPIVAGGTSATSPDNALLNLQAEKYKQIITNWDATVWMAGSFYADITASGTAPVAGHAFAGLVYYANATDFVLQATDITSASHVQYTRIMAAGVWGAWSATNSSAFVEAAGDVMTGNLALAKQTVSPALAFVGSLINAVRWLIIPGDATAETGSNIGSDFVVQAYTDGGAAVTPPAITVKRSLNRVILAGDPAGALDAATKQYVDNAVATGIANVMRTTGNQTVTGGFNFTPFSLTASTSFTVNPMNGNYQYITNNGAFTITAPASDCAVDILVTNGASAGAITLTGFTIAAGNTGDLGTTVNTSKFIYSIRRINGVSTFVIKALQ